MRFYKGRGEAEKAYDVWPHDPAGAAETLIVERAEVARRDQHEAVIPYVLAALEVVPEPCGRGRVPFQDREQLPFVGIEGEGFSVLLDRYACLLIIIVDEVQIVSDGDRQPGILRRISAVRIFEFRVEFGGALDRAVELHRFPPCAAHLGRLRKNPLARHRARRLISHFVACPARSVRPPRRESSLHAPRRLERQECCPAATTGTCAASALAWKQDGAAVGGNRGIAALRASPVA